MQNIKKWGACPSKTCSGLHAIDADYQRIFPLNLSYACIDPDTTAQMKGPAGQRCKAL